MTGKSLLCQVPFTMDGMCPSTAVGPQDSGPLDWTGQLFAHKATGFSLSVFPLYLHLPSSTDEALLTACAHLDL